MNKLVIFHENILQSALKLAGPAYVSECLRKSIMSGCFLGFVTHFSCRDLFANESLNLDAMDGALLSERVVMVGQWGGEIAYYSEDDSRWLVEYAVDVPIEAWEIKLAIADDLKDLSSLVKIFAKDSGGEFLTFKPSLRFMCTIDISSFLSIRTHREAVAIFEYLRIKMPASYQRLLYYSWNPKDLCIHSRLLTTLRANRMILAWCVKKNFIPESLLYVGDDAGACRSAIGLWERNVPVTYIHCGSYAEAVGSFVNKPQFRVKAMDIKTFLESLADL